MGGLLGKPAIGKISVVSDVGFEDDRRSPPTKNLPTLLKYFYPTSRQQQHLLGEANTGQKAMDAIARVIVKLLRQAKIEPLFASLQYYRVKKPVFL